MDMNRAFNLRNEDRKPEWKVIDAQGQVLGRLSTQIADMLRGKDKPYYTPHTDSGDYIIVINAEKIHLTGNKWEQKLYSRYTGWIGGQRIETARQKLEKHPETIIELAVKGMLPKNKLSNQLMRKLRVYTGSEHPHAAQVTPHIV
jgi:large subunit ribosomal protein L13